MELTNLVKARIYQAYAFIAWLIPMVILFIANNSAYISVGTKIGFFGYIMVIFFIIALKSTVLKFFKKNPILAFSTGAFLLSWIMMYMAEQILLVSAVSLVGALLSAIMHPVIDVYMSHAYLIDGEIRKRNRALAITDKEAWAEAYGLVLGDNHE